jgi:hypothetical protein
MREVPAAGFDLGLAMRQVAQPATIPDWVQLFGILVFGVFGGLFVAAIVAARAGAGTEAAADAAEAE